jgi:hypothetical protein
MIQSSESTSSRDQNKHYQYSVVAPPIAFSSESLPAPDAGWIPVRVKKMRQKIKTGIGSD